MIRKLFLIAFLFLFLSSCLKEPQKPSWDVSVLAPLFKTSLSISNILADSLYDTDSTQLIHVVFKELLYEYAPESLLEVPDTITSQVYQSPFNVTLQPGQLFLNKNEDKIYKLADAKLAFITVKSGFLSFQVSNSVKEAILMTYTIPLAKRNGVPFEFTELIPAATESPYYFSKSIDISGYTLDMRGTNGLGANIIGTNLKARLNPNGLATAITPQDFFIADIKFDEFKPSYARGYFGNTPLDLNGTSYVDMFKTIKDGSFDIEKININLDIINGFGVDARIVIDEMASINSNTGQNVMLHSALLGQAVNIMRATETGTETMPVTPSIYPLDFSNDNIKQLFENMPDSLSFKVYGQVNPLGNISGGNDFYYSPYGLKLFLNLDIPMSIKINELTLIDTVKFNFENNTDKNRITKGKFNLIAENGFPFDALIQLYLLDENAIPVDSLLFNNLIAAAPLDNDNIVSMPRRTVVQSNLNEQIINKLYEAKEMLIKVVFNTNNSQYVKLYDFYKIDLKLTGDFDFIVEQ